MFKPTRDAFVECQESVVSEINSALLELKAGMNEQCYNRLRDLRNELITDIRISTEKEPSDSDQTLR